MARKSRSAGKNSRRNGKPTDPTTAGPTLPFEVEELLRQEFEALVERMQVPESAAAYTRLSDISAEDIEASFRDAMKEREQRPSTETESKEPALFVPLARAEEFNYPCVVLCSLNYFATGEGHLLGLLIVKVAAAADLREEVVRAWGDYYSPCVKVRPWDDLSNDGVPLPTEPARKALTKTVFHPSAFRYVSTLHVRYA